MKLMHSKLKYPRHLTPSGSLGAVCPLCVQCSSYSSNTFISLLSVVQRVCSSASDWSIQWIKKGLKRLRLLRKFQIPTAIKVAAGRPSEIDQHDLRDTLTNIIVITLKREQSILKLHLHMLRFFPGRRWSKTTCWSFTVVFLKILFP